MNAKGAVHSQTDEATEATTTADSIFMTCFQASSSGLARLAATPPV